MTQAFEKRNQIVIGALSGVLCITEISGFYRIGLFGGRYCVVDRFGFCRGQLFDVAVPAKNKPPGNGRGPLPGGFTVFDMLCPANAGHGGVFTVWADQSALLAGDLVCI
ncbi:hypothetical protein [uncultured Thalassospira sp.]|uniref:hypothetical protein n=1 Tax=uncultured Thalassospira sp. TaxID=404382 RepID=UPI0030DA2F5C